ncbi:MAG: AMP-binding protein [Zhengella sp.]|uniref:AMP-binding protein n=1 Tax=Zhengella sp. TaxID=2282762 RepID=UPI0035288E26
MRKTVIPKPASQRDKANMRDYQAEAASFTWDDARALLDGLPGGGLNIAHEAVTRHVLHGHGDTVAIRWLSKTGERKDITYGELDTATNRFANVLRRLGIGRGERVFSLLGRVPALYVCALGTLKAGCVYSPLFSAFGPGSAIAHGNRGGQRAGDQQGALQAQDRADPRQAAVPEAILLVDGAIDGDTGIHGLDALMAQAGDRFQTEATQPEDTALIHFHVRHDRRPKGAVHVHESRRRPYLYRPHGARPEAG